MEIILVIVLGLILLYVFISAWQTINKQSDQQALASEASYRRQYLLKTDPVAREQFHQDHGRYPNEDDFATSVAVGAITGSAMLGTMAGGSILGAMVGASIAEQSHHSHHEDIHNNNYSSGDINTSSDDNSNINSNSDDSSYDSCTSFDTDSCSSSYDSGSSSDSSSSGGSD